MIQALLTLVLASDASYWADSLSSPDPALRRLAVEQLVRLGEEAAQELERREFPDPEARRRSRAVLLHLRRPVLVLDCLPQVGLGDGAIEIDLVVRNPAASPVTIPPFRAAGEEGSAWVVHLPHGLGPPEPGGDAGADPIVIEARASATIPIRLPITATAPGELVIGVSCRHESTVLDAAAVVTVARDGFALLRSAVLSRDPHRRAAALRTIGWRLRKQDASPDFAEALQAAARSPWTDVREGVARALAAEGAGPHAPVLLALAADGEQRVAEAAFRGIARRFDLGAAPPELHRLAARYLVSRREWRPSAVEAMLASVAPGTRHRFLAGVLLASRAPPVHEAVVRILNREGIPISTEPASGLVPRSSIATLRR